MALGFSIGPRKPLFGGFNNGQPEKGTDTALESEFEASTFLKDSNSLATYEVAHNNVVASRSTIVVYLA